MQIADRPDYIVLLTEQERTDVDDAMGALEDTTLFQRRRVGNDRWWNIENALARYIVNTRTYTSTEAALAEEVMSGAIEQIASMNQPTAAEADEIARGLRRIIRGIGEQAQEDFERRQRAEECAECGHLHFDPVTREYILCPLRDATSPEDGCMCPYRDGDVPEPVLMGFSILGESWYRDSVLRQRDFIEEVMIGRLVEEGGERFLLDEFTLRWRDLSNAGAAARHFERVSLEVSSESWTLMASRPELLGWLASRSGVDVTCDEVVTALLAFGYRDMTPRTEPRPR